MQGIEPLFHVLRWFLRRLGSLVSSVREIGEQYDRGHAGEEEDHVPGQGVHRVYIGAAEYQEPPGTLWNGCSTKCRPDAINLITVFST